MQGRGLSTHAFTHALDTNHHMFMKLENGKVGGPPNAQIQSPCLSDGAARPLRRAERAMWCTPAGPRQLPAAAEGVRPGVHARRPAAAPVPPSRRCTACRTTMRWWTAPWMTSARCSTPRSPGSRQAQGRRAAWGEREARASGPGLPRAACRFGAACRLPPLPTLTSAPHNRSTRHPPDSACNPPCAHAPAPRQVSKLDTGVSWVRGLDGGEFMPGLVGMNNMKANDYANAVLQVLARVTPIRCAARAVHTPTHPSMPPTCTTHPTHALTHPLLVARRA